jgi:large subunit ribosomal protein L21
MKIAVIKTGGKQYVVKEGDKVAIEKVAAEAGKNASFKDILLVADTEGKEMEIGTPTVKGKNVEAVIEKQFRAPKITVLKFKAKSRYHKKKGHKQHQTMVKIGKIS